MIHTKGGPYAVEGCLHCSGTPNVVSFHPHRYRKAPDGRTEENQGPDYWEFRGFLVFGCLAGVGWGEGHHGTSGGHSGPRFPEGFLVAHRTRRLGWETGLLDFPIAGMAFFGWDLDGFGSKEGVGGEVPGKFRARAGNAGCKDSLAERRLKTASLARRKASLIPSSYS